MARLDPYLNYYVLDIARAQDGAWTVIEINDAVMSGLAGCSSNDLYQGLARVTSRA